MDPNPWPGFCATLPAISTAPRRSAAWTMAAWCLNCRPAAMNGRTRCCIPFAGHAGDGVGPVGSLTLDVNGNLYGTTLEKGGGHHGCGAVFRLSPDADRKKWKETLLHVFSCKPFGDQATSALTYQGKETGALYDGISRHYMGLPTAAERVPAPFINLRPTAGNGSTRPSTLSARTAQMAAPTDERRDRT